MRGVFFCIRQDLRIRAIAFRAGKGQVKAYSAGCLKPGVCHVVAVADPGDFQFFYLPSVFDNGHDIAEDLAWMVPVGQSVDHRNGCVSGQFIDNLLAKGTNHQPVYISGHDPGHVLERFVSGKLGVPAGKIDDLASKPIHGPFKRDPGPG